jgi:hypothetical protein
MLEPDNDDDKTGSKWVWPHPADMGTVLIAGVFLAGMVGTIIWLFSSPEPVRDMFHNKPAEQSQEVTIDLQKK